MSRAKKTRKFAQVKLQIKQRDSRLKKNILANDEAQRKPKDDEVIREV